MIFSVGRRVKGWYDEKDLKDFWTTGVRSGFWRNIMLMKIRVFWGSMRHAASGIVFALVRERNFQIECGFALVALALAFWIPLLPSEWALLLFVIGWVLTLELINTIIERILDIVKPNVHPYVRVVKDMAAGAVLIASFISVLIGIFIFLPHFIG